MDTELDQLGERIAEQAANFDAAMYRLLVDLREFDERGGWHAQGARSCAHWLSWRVSWTLPTARDRVRVARKLPEAPAISDALRRGEVSYSKVRAMLRVATPANEALLLDYSRLMTASQLEKTCRKYALVLRHGQDPHPLGDLQRRYVRRRDTEDGMVKIEAVLHPEEAEIIWGTLSHAATQLARSLSPNESTSNNVSAETRHSNSGPTSNNVSAETRATPMPMPMPMPTSMPMPTPVPMPMPVPVPTSMPMPMPVPVPTSMPVPMPMPMPVPMPVPVPVPMPVPVPVPLPMPLPMPVPVPVPLPMPMPMPVPVPVAIEALRGTTSMCRGSGPRNVSAETPDPAQGLDEQADGSGSKSLLDHLLDEAEMLRAARTVPEGIDQPAAAASERAEQALGIEPRHTRPSSTLHQRADATRRAFNRADALVALAQSYLRGDRPNRAPIDVTLTIPAASLRAGSQPPANGVHPVDVGELGDSFVSCEAARRLSCDCGVTEVIEDDNGIPLSVGRKRRTISGRLKRALLERDKTCTFPGCTNHLFLEGHHIKHWADGGETSLSNAALLCSLCRARHKEHYAAYRVMPRSWLDPDEGGVLYAA